jgi:hypothetical protein
MRGFHVVRPRARERWLAFHVVDEFDLIAWRVRLFDGDWQSRKMACYA